jgi:uncharacterized damage-inducible protein DinB
MDERYPIGSFTLPAGVSAEERIGHVASIESHPRELRAILAGMDDADLERRYREGGWSIRQVVHHLADSHVNAYVRFKLGLTEDEPRIKTYEEARWAELPDTSRTPVEVSVRLLEALHTRWTELLHGITDEPAVFARRLSHPELGVITLDQMLALYAWHGPHHVAHIRLARGRGVAKAGT